MTFRAVALALALTFGMTAVAGAKQKTSVHRVSNKKYKANRVKPRKVKRLKNAKVAKSRRKHTA